MKTLIHNTTEVKAVAQQYAHFWTITLTVSTVHSRDNEVELFFEDEQAFNEAKKGFYNIKTEDCRPNKQCELTKSSRALQDLH